MDARIQLFDYKTKYAFQTSPGVDKYNIPLYDIQTEPGSQSINFYPVYQGFMGPAYINGVPVAFQTQKSVFYNMYPNITQNLSVVGVGDGVEANFDLSLPLLSNSTPINPPVSAILRGHVDITGIIATGNNIDPPIDTGLNANIPSTSIEAAVYITTSDSTGANMVVTDSGQFLSSNVNYGLLMTPGPAPFGYSQLSGGYSASLNTINYLTGAVNVTFPSIVPDGVNINAQVYYFQAGLPSAVLFNNNTLTLRVPPSQQWLVELDAYLTPAAYLSSSAGIQFAYMAEYIARGAARKILSDTGDIEQFNFYEPLFREQEMLVWKRSQRQFTATRTETIFSQGYNQVGSNTLGRGIY